MFAKGGKPIGERLNRNIDDIDLILRQLAEVVAVPKAQRSLPIPPESVTSLVRLLTQKEHELNANFVEAQEIASRQEVVNALEEEVRKRDDEIAKIHACLKDAETMLITAIFQANQKLKSIATASKRKISAEELIRYSHRISASNSVAAPLTWQQGDPDRPYPTEGEMRAGWLVDTNVPHLQNTLMQAMNMMPTNPLLQGPSGNPLGGHPGLYSGVHGGASGMPQHPATTMSEHGMRGAGGMPAFMSPQHAGVGQRPGSIPTTPTHQVPPGGMSWNPTAGALGPGPGGGPRNPTPAQPGAPLAGGHGLARFPTPAHFLPQPPSVEPETSVGEMSSDSSDSSSSGSPD